MDARKFKKIFGAVAVENGFKKVPGGWYKESDECLVILNLQKSSYSNLYYLNTKTYVHGTFEERYTPSKYWVVNYPGGILSDLPKEYSVLFNLENSLSVQEREEGIRNLFIKFLNEYSEKLLTKVGLRELYTKNEVFVLDGTRKKLVEMEVL